MARNKKKRLNYAESFLQLAELGVAEARYLCNVLEKLPIEGKSGDVPVLDEAHAIEAAANDISIAVYQAAEIDFVTPIDRGDLLEITRALDNVVDELEDVVQELYMYAIKKPTKMSKKMCSLVCQEAETLRDAIQDYHDTRKFKHIRKKIAEVKRLEHEHDRLYVDGMRELFSEHADDPVYVVQWKSIYSAIEYAADTIEHVGVVLLTTAVKDD